MSNEKKKEKEKKKKMMEGYSDSLKYEKLLKIHRTKRHWEAFTYIRLNTSSEAQPEDTEDYR